MLIQLLAPVLAFAAPLHAPSAQDPSDAQSRQDQAFWSELAATLRERHGVAAALPEDPRNAELRALTRSTHLTPPRLEDVEDLGAVTQALAALTGIPIVLDPRAADAMINEGVAISLDWTHPTALGTVLDTLVTMAGEEVSWTVDEGAIVVTTRDRARAEQHVFLHPIADLSGLFEPEDLAVLAQENVAPGSWVYNGVAIEPTSTFLVVVHTREVHLGVERLLGDLRAFQVSLRQPPTFAPSPGELEQEKSLSALAQVRFAADFHAGGAGTHIAQVAAFLQELSGMNFLVSQAVRDELDEEAVRVDFNLPETDLLTVLNLIPRVCPDLRWTLAGDVVRFHTAEELGGSQIFSLFDVRSIIEPAPQGFTFRVRPDDELEAMVLHPTLLEELIRHTIDPQSWDNDPTNLIRISSNGVMTVKQTPAALNQLRAFLKNLQTIADTMTEVGRQHAR
ncbi:MAG: hypothetical protein GY711_09090 [bacterium]|nr:hypothetical protein [bacterium]